jgi:hypothetical protein
MQFLYFLLHLYEHLVLLLGIQVGEDVVEGGEAVEQAAVVAGIHGPLQGVDE